MKKAFALLLVFCLVLGLASAAFAAGAPKIIRHPTSQTTDKNGTVTFEFEGSGFTDVSWRFVNPETGEEWTGKQLKDVITAKGFTISVANGRQRVKLTKVPETMHGWDVYAVLSNKAGYSVNTYTVKLWCYGLPQTGSASAQQEQPIPTPAPADADPAPAAVPAGNEGVEQIPEQNQPAVQENDELLPEPKTITVTAENLTLYPVDARGSIREDQAASTLTFEGSGNVAVRSDAPVKYWLVNGIRIEPMDNVTGFVLKNITGDLTISAKLDRGSAAAAEEVDNGNLCRVTCEGCTFTYNAGGLRSVSAGEVPAGATIIVLAASGSDVSKGYRVNGGNPEHAGSTSFRLKITEDTVITLP